MQVTFHRRAVNFIRNPRMEGAVPGTPGTAPSNMSVTNTSGLTLSIIGTGSEGGVPYVDVGFAGTSSAGGGTVIVSFDTATAVPAILGQLWTESLFCKLQAGALTGITAILNSLAELDAGTAGLAVHTLTITPPGTSLETTRSQIPFVLNQATVAFVRGQLRITIPALTAVTCTLRIGAPQLELAGVASPMILPPPGAPGTSQGFF